MTDWNSVFQNAVQMDNLGKFAEAIKLYQLLLTQFPDHPVVLENFGTVLLKAGDFERAIDIYQHALSVNSNQANVYYNLGIALRQANKPREAIAHYDKALALAPDFIEALANRCSVLVELKQFTEAVAGYDQAIRLNPGFAEIWSNRGNALLGLRLNQEAIASFNQAIALNRSYAEAYTNRGNAFLNLKRYQPALADHDKAITLKPNYTEAWSNRGNVLVKLKRFTEAVASYDKALAFNAEYAEGWSNRGNALAELERYAEALTHYDKAIALKPDYAEAWSNKGNVLQEVKRYTEALACYDRALALSAEYIEAWYSKGRALEEMRQLSEALTCHDRAIALKPDCVEAWSNKGIVLQELHQFAEAMTCYDRVNAIDPEFVLAWWNKSLLLILQGEYQTGWQLYEWRFKLDKNDSLRPYPKPQYLGQDLANKTVLLYPEQGHGDFIQFCRYAKLLADAGGQVILEVSEPLLALTATLDSRIKLVPTGTIVRSFDYHSPLMSLPLACKTRLDTIPATPAYLHADEAKTQFWQQHLGKQRQKRIGLVWSGSAEHKNDGIRSIALALFADLLNLPFEFHCLQKEIRADDLAFLQQHSNLHEHRALLKDYADTAALLMAMDLVISVDSSVAHLAGALGKPVWILLTHIPDYRWLMDRTDSPWYPSATLYRQDESRKWPGVMAEIVRELSV